MGEVKLSLDQYHTILENERVLIGQLEEARKTEKEKITGIKSVHSRELGQLQREKERLESELEEVRENQKKVIHTTLVKRQNNIIEPVNRDSLIQTLRDLYRGATVPNDRAMTAMEIHDSYLRSDNPPAYSYRSARIIEHTANVIWDMFLNRHNKPQPTETIEESVEYIGLDDVKAMLRKELEEDVKKKLERLSVLEKTLEDNIQNINDLRKDKAMKTEIIDDLNRKNEALETELKEVLERESKKDRLPSKIREIMKHGYGRFGRGRLLDRIMQIVEAND